MKKKRIRISKSFVVLSALVFAMFSLYPLLGRFALPTLQTAPKTSAEEIPVAAKVQQVLPPAPVSDTVLDVPYLSQEGSLPTGCEVVSAAMVLQYWHLDITAEELAEMLPCSPLEEKEDGLHGPDPNQYFVGSPFDPSSYGCYAPVIANLIGKAAPKLSAQVLYDRSLEELYGEGVFQGKPVLLWCTINMLESYEGASWILPDGTDFTWHSNEHCLVLVGREGEEYICMDPYDSNGQISIPAELLKERYEEMGSQAVVISPL